VLSWAAMAYLDPHEAHQHLQEQVTGALRQVFPIVGIKESLHLKEVLPVPMLDPEDLHGQHEAKLGKKSWATPVHAIVERKDATGKVLETRKMRLMDIPAMTKRMSFIYEGQEHQISNQWQLKPGVYTRRQQNGELETRFNVTHRASFKLKLDPESQLFTMEYKKANLPAYPMLKAMGVTDEEMRRTWGDSIFKANAEGRRQTGALAQFFRTSTNGKEPPADPDRLKGHLQQVMRESVIRPEVAKATLGKEIGHVDGDLMLRATDKLLKVQAGHPEDDRDSLEFKTLRAPGELLADQIIQAGKTVGAKVQRQLNRGELPDMRYALRPGQFNESVRKLFQSSLANPAKQINPLDMLSSALQTTIMGPGGIKSETQVTDDAKLIHPSQIGTIDPLVTPEGGSTGISLRLALGVKKVGDQPMMPVYSIKEGKTVYLDPVAFMRSKVVMADQVEFKNGKPVPLSANVKALGEKNSITQIPFSQAEYVLKSPTQLFNITPNLVPFLGNNSGGRVTYASKHMEQAISLLDRDAPLVQTKTPGDTHIGTFEKLVGHQTSHMSPVEGRVKSVDSKYVTVEDKTGKIHRVSLYDHYPTNDSKSVLHSTPLVKPGDMVRPGQVVADNNYTKEGVLALGKNLKVAFMSYHGLNFEDGIVVTESAAKKLSSVHLHKHTLPANDQLVFDVKKFQSVNPLTFTEKQYSHIDSTGVAKIGSKVRPGDPLVVALQPYQIKDRTGIAAIRKSLTNSHLDKSVKWEGDVEGEVVAVHRNEDGVHVHVRAIEPLIVGDKLSNRAGGKGIVTRIIPDKEAPRSKEGAPVDIIFQPAGLGGRMNMGQIYEAMTGKIAQKTGQPFVVENFDPKVKDWSAHVNDLLKKHNVSDTEELIDPKTGLSYGKVLTGPIHFLKLVHQVSKKESARSGMSLPKLPSGERYDPTTLQPASGDGTGGQSWGQLGMYGLLAHGAKGVLRESMTFKSEGEDPETNEFKRWKSQHNEVWRAIQTGQPLPPPKPTFAFHRFTELIKGAGINVEKKGDEFLLSPLTDKHILNMSKGEVVDPVAVVHAKQDENGVFKPIKGGLFDEKVMGGHGGINWGHVKLAEPIPHPVFEEPIKKILGISQDTFSALLHGKKSVDPITGKLQDGAKGLVGGHAFKALLSKIDVKKELERTKDELSKAKPTQLQPLYKKARYLKALDQMGMKPDEAYILHNLPILPPKIRPLTGMEDGSLHYEGINGLYVKFGQMNKNLSNPLNKMLPAATLGPYRENLYESVSNIFGTMALPEGAKDKGALHIISGTSPKSGFAQKGLLARRQEPSARSTIIPEPKLKLDEIGIPKDMALTVFRPQMVRQLVVQGLARDEGAAQQLLSDVHKGRKDSGVDTALQTVLQNELVIAKRDPVLWKYGVQAFKPKMVEGKAIRIHPLVTGGFNADFDGDSCLGKVFVKDPEGIRVVDLADFPRTEKTSTTSKVECYGVPEDTFVIGEIGGAVTFHRVTEYSVHFRCKEWVVTLSLGTEIRCSEDHSLTLFDDHFLKTVEASPRGSVGRYVPIAGKMQEHLHSHVRFNGSEELVADFALGKRVGSWVAGQDRCPAHDRNEGEDELDPHISSEGAMLSALSLPIGYRRGVVVGYMRRRLNLKDATVTSCAHPKALIALLRSVGMNAVVLNEKTVALSLIDMRDEENDWFRVPRSGKIQHDQMPDEEIPCPTWIQEEIPPSLRPGKRATRRWLFSNLHALRECSGSRYFLNWLNLMSSRTLFWERVVSATMSGEAVTMYDLTVESAKNFTLDSGHVVWDTMSVQPVLSEEAKRDAHRMLPSKNIFSESTGGVAYSPSMEAQLGLHRLSLVGDKTSHSFKTQQEAVIALGHGKLKVSDQIQVGAITTTPGRILLAAKAPEFIQHKILTDFSMNLNGGGIRKVLSDVGKKDANAFAPFADHWKDLGYDASTGIISHPLHPAGKLSIGAHSFSMADFVTDKQARDPVLQQAHQQVDKIRARDLPQVEKDRLAVETYLKADHEIQKRHEELSKGKFNALKAMKDAGIKPSQTQYKQILLAPMVMVDSKGRMIPVPVDKSYAEGIDLTGYTVQQYGARAGAIKKVQEVQEPGYMTKLLQNVAMDKVIDAHDCGTNRGIRLPVAHTDVVDRHLMAPLDLPNLKLPAGQLLTRDLVDQIRKLDPKAELQVRTPLHCHSHKGVCQKCYGLDANGKHPEMGTNIGVLSAHAVGERAVQLTLKAFHAGGVASAGGGALGAFGRLEQLTYLPDTIPNAAVHAKVSGKVEKIESTPTGSKIWIAGQPHFVGRDANGHDLHKPLEGFFYKKPWKPVEVGTHVDPGQFLTDPNRTLLNPHRYYEATRSMDKVQEVLADEIHEIYKDEGVRRRAVETLVRGMGNLTRIEDPKDHPDLLRGQHYPRKEVERINRERMAMKLTPIQHEPILKGVNVLPLEMTEDFMARLNHQRLRHTLMEGAAQGWKSDIHGRHPIPGLMYGAEFGKPSQDPKKSKAGPTFY